MTHVHGALDVHGNGKDWDPMGLMGFPWEWELRYGSEKTLQLAST